MANQSPDRRAVLEMIALAAAAGRFDGFARWVCAPQHAAEASAEPRPHSYEPQFFTAEEFSVLEQLCELIIPADESPGAREAGVAEFIDFMAANDNQLQWPFRYGVDWLNARATGLHGTNFIALTQAQQIELLRTIAARDVSARGDGDGRNFFALLRKYTVMGYYTSRIGMEELNYPGLRSYSESPGCSHTGDPEHKHLPAARI